MLKLLRTEREGQRSRDGVVCRVILGPESNQAEERLGWGRKNALGLPTQSEIRKPTVTLVETSVFFPSANPGRALRRRRLLLSVSSLPWRVLNRSPISPANDTFCVTPSASNWNGEGGQGSLY